MTVAVTGQAGGPVTGAAERSVVIERPELRRSPGIRTYQASLLGLLLTAIRAGTARGRHGPRQARPAAGTARGRPASCGRN